MLSLTIWPKIRGIYGPGLLDPLRCCAAPGWGSKVIERLGNDPGPTSARESCLTENGDIGSVWNP